MTARTIDSSMKAQNAVEARLDNYMSTIVREKSTCVMITSSRPVLSLVLSILVLDSEGAADY